MVQQDVFLNHQQTKKQANKKYDGIGLAGCALQLMPVKVPSSTPGAKSVLDSFLSYEFVVGSPF